jgi:chromate transporter
VSEQCSHYSRHRRISAALPQKLADVAALFLKLGVTAFGGPAAHIAMMHDETVQRRKWLDDQEFLDLVGATNLIPGPNSTEMAIHIGLLRAGWPGLITGGFCFIMPAMLIVMLLAWIYVRFGSVPQTGWLLYGVNVASLGLMAAVTWQLGRASVTDPLTVLIALISFGLLVRFKVNSTWLIAGGALVGLSSALLR